MKHYGVVSGGCVLGGWWRVCVFGRVVESAGCVCWEGDGECRVCVCRAVVVPDPGKILVIAYGNLAVT